MEIGERLTILREGRNLTQDELAEEMGVTRQTVSKWECNKGYPELSILKSLAEFYGVSVDFILGVSADEEIDKTSQAELKPQ